MVNMQFDCLWVACKNVECSSVHPMRDSVTTGTEILLMLTSLHSIYHILFLSYFYSYSSVLQLRAGFDHSRLPEVVDTIEVPTSAGLGNGAVIGLAASKCGLMAALEENDHKMFIYNHERCDVLEFPLDCPEFSFASQIAFDMYNNIIIAQGEEGPMLRFNMNGKALPHLDVPVNSQSGVACSPEGEIFVSSYDQGTIMKQAIGQSEWVTIYRRREEDYDEDDEEDADEDDFMFDPKRFGPGQMSIGSDGELFVLTDEDCINVLNTSDGKVKRQIGCDKYHGGELSNVEGICVTGDGYLFVSDQKCFVHVFTTDGEYMHKFGGNGNGPGQFQHPWGITVDWQGYLLVSDAQNGKIKIF